MDGKKSYDKGHLLRVICVWFVSKKIDQAINRRFNLLSIISLPPFFMAMMTFFQSTWGSSTYTHG